MKKNIDKNLEEVEFWTFGCVNGNIRIFFDKQTKFIEVTPEDLRTMMDWVNMHNGTYVPRTY